MTNQKAFTKPHTIWNTVWPFHIVMKLFGYACFSIDGNITEGKIKCKFVDIFGLFIAIGVISGLIYLNYAFNLSLILTSSRVINIGSRFVLLFGITNVLFSCLLMFFRRNKVWNIFTSCHKFDEEMAVLRILLDHKGHLRKFTFVAIGCFVLFVTMTVMSNYFLYYCIDPSISFFLIFSYNTINGSMSTSLISTAFTLYAIYQRFNLINIAMRKFFVTEEEEEEEAVGEKGRKASILLCKVVAKLADLHDSLVDIVNAFNYCFSFQIMNVVAGMFLTNIFR
jgi:7tm Chemosensory receptor